MTGWCPERRIWRARDSRHRLVSPATTLCDGGLGLWRTWALAHTSGLRGIGRHVEGCQDLAEEFGPTASSLSACHSGRREKCERCVTGAQKPPRASCSATRGWKPSLSQRSVMANPVRLRRLLHARTRSPGAPASHVTRCVWTVHPPLERGDLNG